MRYNVKLWGGIFVILVIIFFFVESPWSKRIRAPKKINLSDFRISDIAKIDLKSKDKEFILVKRNNKWFLQKDTIFLPVDSARIERTLNAFEDIEGELVGTNSEDFELYQVNEEKGIHVIASDEKGSVLADLFVGKMGPDFSSNYVRANNRNEVIIVEKYLRAEFPMYKKSWINRKLTNFKGEDVVEFHHKFGDEFKIIKKDGKYYYEGDTVKLDSMKVIQYLRMIGNIIAMDILDTLSIKDAGFDNPQGIFEITTKDGAYHALFFGNTPEDGMIWYVTDKNKKYVYTLSKSYVENALKKTKDYFIKKKEEKKAKPKKEKLKKK